MSRKKTWRKTQPQKDAFKGVNAGESLFHQQCIFHIMIYNILYIQLSIDVCNCMYISIPWVFTYIGLIFMINYITLSVWYRIHVQYTVYLPRLTITS